MAAIKYSRQREAIKHYLASTKEHPTADTVYLHVKEDFPNISLGTVYRNLNLLTDIGEAIKIPTPDGGDRFDGNVIPHNHFLCTSCGRLLDLELDMKSIEEVNRLAGEYLSRLTGQRYRRVSFTRELEGSAATAGDLSPRSALSLSRGTADQLYLSLRLAVCRLCLPEKPPIVLDDALAAFDDQRLGQALDLLQELAQDQQVLLFTCHRREGELLTGTPGVTKLALP